MEGRVAVGAMALNAGAGATLLADVACQLPTGGWDVLDTIDWFQKHLKGEKPQINWIDQFSRNSFYINPTREKSTLIWIRWI